MAVAMILWYNTDLRATQDRLWQELNFAQKATFHADLAPAALETWPVDGPHVFTDSESQWLTETLLYLKKGPWRCCVCV
jgi:hypothetical protein